MLAVGERVESPANAFTERRDKNNRVSIFTAQVFFFTISTGTELLYFLTCPATIPLRVEV